MSLSLDFYHPMNEPQKPRIYRELIDELVRMCKDGQGQMGAQCARMAFGIGMRRDFIPEQHEVNLLLKRMTPEIERFSLAYWRRKSSLACLRRSRLLNSLRLSLSKTVMKAVRIMILLDDSQIGNGQRLNHALQ